MFSRSLTRSTRGFSTSKTSPAAFFARTRIAPNLNTTLSPPQSLNAKALLILATPTSLPVAIENAISLHQIAKTQVVVAGVDSVVPNGVRSGLSELWLDEYMDISDSVHLNEKDHKQPLRESDGVHAVGARENWKTIDASLKVQVTEGETVDLSLANTAFATNTLATLFYFQPKELQEVTKDKNMGETLCELTVKLPALAPALSRPQSMDRWTPLGEGDNLEITECTGNLVKKINTVPAAKFLENNDDLMSIKSKDTKVYVKVHQKDGIKKYEVIAGGGGWGAKADLLAISPEAKLKKGDKLEFFMITPEDRFKGFKTQVVSNQFLFECTPEATKYEEAVKSEQSVDNLFGCGCEHGFLHNGINCKSPGEALSFRF
ncbi:hypothetical protein FT663_04201 [Candidozyma haemuli var. vulneris]|nr:hypothetical protein FT662_04597 [[Candida] haemuloni var. vulneris]KAF3988030.1 hypothetical protein FT663_04201 [[Candida] haemuloni var. vulneris]